MNTVKAYFNAPFQLNGYEYSGRWEFRIIDELEDLTWRGDVENATEVTDQTRVVVFSNSTWQEINSRRYIVERLTDPTGETYDERITCEFVAILAHDDTEEDEKSVDIFI